MATVDTLTAIQSSHAVYLNRVAAHFGNEVDPYLEDIEKYITKRLNALPKRSLTTQDRNELSKDINDYTKEQLQAYTAQYKLNNKELGVNEAAFQAQTLEDVTENVEPVTPPATAINTLAIRTPIQVGDNQFTTYNRYIASYWRNYTDLIDSTVQAGFSTGGTNQEISARILDQISIGNDYGDLAKAQRAAKTMTRTATNHYGNAASDAFYSVNDDVIIGVRFLATLDNRVSRQCSALDQTVWKLTDQSRPKPPLHPNCRSTTVAEIDGRYTYDDDSAKRPSNFTDSDDDRNVKKVSSKKTYYEEVKKMNLADRTAVLDSPTLARALGQMDADTFAKSVIDSTYNPLTIAEMTVKNNELGKVLRNMNK